MSLKKLKYNNNLKMKKIGFAGQVEQNETRFNIPINPKPDIEKQFGAAWVGGDVV